MSSKAISPIVALSVVTLATSGALVEKAPLSAEALQIDSTRSPKWLTRFTRGGKVNFVENAIYRFDGEELVICKTAHLDGRRPTRFNADEGDGEYVFVMRRKNTKDRTESH
jgi:uncharacterized protein (TIGR03067 family)